MKKFIVFTDWYRPGKRSRTITRRHEVMAVDILEACQKAIAKHNPNSLVSMVWPVWPQA